MMQRGGKRLRNQHGRHRSNFIRCVVENISGTKATLPQLFFAQETTNCIMSGRGKCISTHYEHCEFVDCVLCASEFIDS